MLIQPYEHKSSLIERYNYHSKKKQLLRQVLTAKIKATFTKQSQQTH